MSLRPIGTPPKDASAQLLAAWAIIQNPDRSTEQLNRLIDLQQDLPADHDDRRKIAGLIEAFTASAD